MGPRIRTAADAPVTRLDDYTVVVLADNPSLMTLDGTNTYLIGAPDSGGVIVVDPGPDLAPHRRAIDAAAAQMSAEVVAVVATHHHADHAEAGHWATDWGANLYAFAPSMVATPAQALLDGQRISAAGVTLEVLHTPGHSSDHVCLRLPPTDVVFSGDHVLGTGTSVVLWPDGDMAAYMASLDRLAGLGARALYPGHGPVVTDPATTIAGYVTHRRGREAQILAAIGAGATTVVAIVSTVYADLDATLTRFAECSVRAHLADLMARGELRRTGADPSAEADEHYRA